MSEKGGIWGAFGRAVAGAFVGAVLAVIGLAITCWGRTDKQIEQLAPFVIGSGALGMAILAAFVGGEQLGGWVKGLAIWVSAGAVAGILLGAFIYPAILADEQSRVFGVAQLIGVVVGPIFGAIVAALVLCSRWLWLRAPQ